VGEGTLVSIAKGSKLVIVQSDSVYEVEADRNKLITQKDIVELLDLQPSQVIKNIIEKKIIEEEQLKVVSNKDSDFLNPKYRSSGRNEQSISSFKRKLLSIQSNKYNHSISIQTDFLIFATFDLGINSISNYLQFVFVKNRNTHSYNLRGPPFYS